ncbi:MAG: PfkB family carbohydrate kinase [Anaerolineales bacterium]|nr:PfkB family carbohydrate kinase [Anaerolineales bacterium]NUQ83135.1 ribokinase [Anaerolineales bacterium]
MPNLVPLEPVDYLVIGHVARDLTPKGAQLGGTVAYSALTARALGMRVGIVTAAGTNAPLEPLNEFPLVLIESDSSTTYENIFTTNGRVQYLLDRAARIELDRVPDSWRTASIIHLAPIADEVDSVLPEGFSPALLGLTPQGWMRQWDAEGLVLPRAWKDAARALTQAGAVVFSREDVNGDDLLIEQLAQQTKILVVTEGAAGAVLYWHGDRRRFRAPSVREVDATGAGDIFAAAFFIRYLNTRDPWEATRFATLLASHSVERTGLDGIPTQLEIEQSRMVVIP